MPLSQCRPNEMWYNHLVYLKIKLVINLLIIVNYAYCGYIGPNQRTNLNRGKTYHRGKLLSIK